MLDDDEDISPNIAAILQNSADDDVGADLGNFFDDKGPNSSDLAEGVPEVDLSVTQFKLVDKYFEDTPNPVFDDKSYYKTVFSGEDDSAARLHQLLSKYLKCEDKKDRAVYRQQVVSAYWNFLRSLSTKMGSSKTPLCKRLAMRYGAVLPSLLAPEQRDFFSKAIINNLTGEPILYVDEWIKEITAGRLSRSVTDELPSKKAAGPNADHQRILQLQSKNNGKLQNAENLAASRENERERLEVLVQDKINDIFTHETLLGLDPHRAPYTEQQRRLFSEVNTVFRQLLKVDKDLAGYYNELQEAKEIGYSLEAKASELPDDAITVAKEDILSELTTIRQMAKMTCGRQGNQFPILTREFFHCLDKETGFRENVLRELAWIESIDPGCFVRIHRNVPNRIVPYVLLVPTYGDIGFCWEPFDRYNRVTSRGRIIIPMYPRSLKVSCLMAVADLRWQVAKEKASVDWMSEGLTGQYYQYIEGKKLKGDIKQFFINDYILWITKESMGTQKLEKEVRGIFWRHLPFPQERKDDLKKRSMVYQELYQRDINRSMSDGY